MLSFFLWDCNGFFLIGGDNVYGDWNTLTLPLKYVEKKSGLKYVCAHVSLPYMNVCSHTVDSEIFASILFSRIALKDILVMCKIRQCLLISINDRVILPFREGFIFMRSFAKMKSSRKFPNLQYLLNTLMRGSREFSQRGSNFDNVFFKLKKWDPNTIIIRPSSVLLC